MLLAGVVEGEAAAAADGADGGVGAAAGGSAVRSSATCSDDASMRALAAAAAAAMAADRTAAPFPGDKEHTGSVELPLLLRVANPAVNSASIEGSTPFAVAVTAEDGCLFDSWFAPATDIAGGAFVSLVNPSAPG